MAHLKNSRLVKIVVAFVFVCLIICSSKHSVYALTKYNQEAIEKIYKDTIEDYGKVKLKKRVRRWCAHRGYSSRAPENTEAAFILAGMCDAYMAEGDVRPSKTGRPFMMHNSSLQEMTGCKEHIEKLSDSEIQSLKIDSGRNIDKFKDLKICTFEEYLNICRKYKMIPMVDIKTVSDKDLLEKEIKYVVRELKERHLIKNTVITASSVEVLKLYRKYDKNAALFFNRYAVATKEELKEWKKVPKGDKEYEFYTKNWPTS